VKVWALALRSPKGRGGGQGQGSEIWPIWKQMESTRIRPPERLSARTQAERAHPVLKSTSASTASTERIVAAGGMVARLGDAADGGPGIGQAILVPTVVW
jgi:hypothetical protein